MRFGKYYVDAISDYGIERTDQNGNSVICSGFYCRVFDDPEYKNQVDDFCLAVGYEIEDETQEALENGIRSYLGIESALSEKRMIELLGNFVGWFLDHQTSDEGLFRDLHVEIGMTKEELHSFSIEGLDEMFDQAEKEHRREGDETTDMITAEDVVEQAVYMANAPECCADEHAENMLGMLGANIVEPEIYHDEDECPNREDEIEEDVLHIL